MLREDDFEKGVFINGPFDDEYRSLLRPLLFTIIYIDIKSYNDDPVKLVRQVRNWFVETVGLTGVAAPSRIWYSFIDLSV